MSQAPTSFEAAPFPRTPDTDGKCAVVKNRRARGVLVVGLDEAGKEWVSEKATVTVDEQRASYDDIVAEWRKHTAPTGEELSKRWNELVEGEEGLFGGITKALVDGHDYYAVYGPRYNSPRIENSDLPEGVVISGVRRDGIYFSVE